VTTKGNGQRERGARVGGEKNYFSINELSSPKRTRHPMKPEKREKNRGCMLPARNLATTQEGEQNGKTNWGSGCCWREGGKGGIGSPVKEKRGRSKEKGGKARRAGKDRGGGKDAIRQEKCVTDFSPKGRNSEHLIA